MYQRYISELPVLTLSDYKRAALFFDELIICYWFDHKGVYSGMGLVEIPIVQKSVEGPLFINPVEVLHDFESMVESDLKFRVCTARTTRKTPFIFEDNRFDDDSELILNYITETQRDHGRLLVGNWDACGRYDETLTKSEARESGTKKYREDAFRESLGKVKASIGPHDFYGWGFEEMNTNLSSVDMTLTNISIIDTEGLAWEHISELRKDRQAIADLRELRRFLITDMQGLPLSHIEDLLSTALDKHQAAGSKWGLKSLPGEINIDYESSVAIGLLTALGVTLSGSNLSTAAAMGALVPLGQALISINRGRKKFLENSKVGYLAKIRNLTDK